MPRWLWGAAALLVAGAIFAGLLVRTRSNVALITTPVTQTTLVASVTASGTVNPQNLISVGTQVSGTIASIDVDYNSKVTRGEVLARLDPSMFDAQLEQAEAALAQARSQVTQAAASANGAASGITVASANAAAESAAIASAKTNVAKTEAALVLAQKTQARTAHPSHKATSLRARLIPIARTLRRTRATLPLRKPPLRKRRLKASQATPR